MAPPKGENMRMARSNISMFWRDIFSKSLKPNLRAEGLGEFLPHLLLVLREALHRQFEIGGHEGLQGVAVEADQLAKELDRQQMLAALVLFLEDDLRQHLAGDVLAGSRIAHFELDALLHHLAKMIERDVAR